MVVILIKGQQAVLAMILDVADQTNQALDHLLVRALKISNCRRAEVNLEPQVSKRMLPTAQLRIDEDISTFTESCDMRVIVNQQFGIDIVEGTLDEIGRLL